MRHSVILVFANKQDLVSIKSSFGSHDIFVYSKTRVLLIIFKFFCSPQPKALAPAEIVQALGLQQLKNRKWHVQGAIATRGEGLYEGLDWLSVTLKELNRGQPVART